MCTIGYCKDLKIVFKNRDKESHITTFEEIVIPDSGRRDWQKFLRRGRNGRKSEGEEELTFPKSVSEYISHFDQP